MITLQTNSQPASEADKLHDLVGVIYSIVRDDAKQASASSVCPAIRPHERLLWCCEYMAANAGSASTPAC